MEENIKISVDKDDELPVIAAKVFSTVSDEVVLVVPRLSKLAQSVDNLKFLKNGLAGEKTLTIESVDEQILKLAEEAEINAYNPFFNKKVDEEDWSRALPKAVLASTAPVVGDKVFNKAEKELDKTFRPQRQYRNFSGIIFAFILLITAGWFLGIKILPQAEIVVTARKSNWEFKDQIVIKKDIAVVDVAGIKIPGQSFSQKKNVQLSFPTASEKYVEKKARGKLIIYNGYSSKPQPLVATTRFQTPDGKVIRINKGVTVPGANIVDGQIVPSSIEVDVTADKSGDSYNVGPVARLTVPGFKGSPKYNGFYGELKQSLTGGYIGKLAAPTDKEIAVAKEKAIQTVKESLKMLLISQVPSDFEIPDDTSQFRVVRSEVDAQADQKGKFSVFAEAELAIVGFRKSDLLTLFEQKISQDLGDGYNIKSHDLKYQANEVDLDNGKISLLVDFSAVVEKFVDFQSLKDRIAGKSEEELRAAVFALPELEAAKISLWPFWVNRVPKKVEKINIIVD